MTQFFEHYPEIRKDLGYLYDETIGSYPLVI